MSHTRTLASLIATLLIGALTIFIAAPNKTLKAKARSPKTSTDGGIPENDDLFI